MAGLRVQPLIHKRQGKGKEVAMANLDPVSMGNIGWIVGGNETH